LHYSITGVQFRILAFKSMVSPVNETSVFSRKVVKLSLANVSIFLESSCTLHVLHLRVVTEVDHSVNVLSTVTDLYLSCTDAHCAFFLMIDIYTLW
jgi:hypothetical protein